MKIPMILPNIESLSKHISVVSWKKYFFYLHILNRKGLATSL